MPAVRGCDASPDVCVLTSPEARCCTWCPCRVAGPRTVPVEVGRHYMAEGWGQRLMTLSDFIKLHIAQQQKRQWGGHPAGEVQGGAQHPAAAVGLALQAGAPASDAAAAGDSEPPGSSSPTLQVGFRMQHRLPRVKMSSNGAAGAGTSWCT